MAPMGWHFGLHERIVRRLELHKEVTTHLVLLGRSDAPSAFHRHRDACSEPTTLEQEIDIAGEADKDAVHLFYRSILPGR